MNYDPLYLALLALAGVAGSTIGAISGFGGGLLVTPFLVPIVGITGVVPVMTVAMIIGNLTRFGVYRAYIQPRFIGTLSLPVIPGIVIGTTVYDMLSPRVVGFALGAFLIASIPLRRSFGRKPIKLGPVGIGITGFAFGIVTGATTGAGVILLSILLGLGVTGPALIATDAAMGVLVNVIKVGMFGSLSVLDREQLLLGLALGVCMIPGAYGGRWLMRRLPLHVHVTAIEILIGFIGVWFLYKAYSLPG